MSKELSQRYTALDVLRGMTIAGMILVNNPGSWKTIFPPLRHASWHGCTPTDLVFPFFLFIVGAALAFAFAKYNDTLNSTSVKKILKRTLFIFLTGLALNAFPFYNTSPNPELTFGENWMVYLQNLRILGVLQRIALCYMVGALIALWLQKPKKIIIAGVILMFLHWLILVLFGGEDPFSKEGTISGNIDVALIGISHVYKGFGMPFEPEGFIGTLSGSATVLFGYLIGSHIRKSKEKINAVTDLYTVGLISLGVAMALSIFIPINKPLWTPSYVFYAGGWSVMMLALFIYFIDIKGKEKYFFPFKALGLNPLFAFAMSAVMARTFGRIIRWETTVMQDDGTMKETTVSAANWFYQHVCVPLLGNNQFGSLLYAIIYVSIFTAMAIYLYRKKIVIKL